MKTETEIHARVRVLLNNEGLLVRLENVIIPGLPDCLFMYGRHVNLIEYKIIRSNRITMPIYQYSSACMIHKHVANNRHWYFMSEGEDDIIQAYRFDKLPKMKTSVGNGKTVSINMMEIDPDMIIVDRSDIDIWLKLIKEE
jgi:hypothetical protein